MVSGRLGSGWTQSTFRPSGESVRQLVARQQREGVLVHATETVVEGERRQRPGQPGTPIHLCQGLGQVDHPPMLRQPGAMLGEGVGWNRQRGLPVGLDRVVAEDGHEA